MALGKKTGGRRPGSKNKTVSDLKVLAQQYGADAIETLASIFQNPEAAAQARVAAIKELLDRGYGKPAQPVDLSGTLKHVVDPELAKLTGNDIRSLILARRRIAAARPEAN